MALQGDLRTFELPDLLSLIASSRRNGMLVVKRGDEEKSLYFSDGLLIYASSTTERERLGEVLVRERLLDSDGVVKARKIQHGTGERLGTVLVSHNFLPPARLVLGLKAQAQEIITSLFQWWSGSFEFIDGEYPYPSPIVVGFNLQALIMEATKTVDDWARIKRVLPDLSLYLAVNAKLAENVQSVFLQRQEWEMLSLVDGRRHIQEICSLSQYSDLETCEILANLVGRGLLLVKASEDEVWRDDKLAAERSVYRPFIRMMNEIYYVICDAIQGTDAERMMNDAIREVEKHHTLLLNGVEFSRGTLDAELLLANLRMLEEQYRPRELTEALFNIIVFILRSIKVLDRPLFLQTTRDMRVVLRLLMRRQSELIDALKLREKFEKLVPPDEKPRPM
jgi:hypothetical protein